MSSEIDKRYRARREWQERNAASQADTDLVRKIHEESANSCASGPLRVTAEQMPRISQRPHILKAWHAEDIEHMFALLSADVRVPEIARRLGRTQEAVTRKAKLLDRMPS